MSEAIYWSVADVEYLTHESPEDALVAWLDDWIGTSEELTPRCPIIVTGYSRRKVEGAADYAEDIVERLRENLAEEYGDPDGDFDVLSEKVEKELLADVTAAVEKALARGVSWQCEPTETRSFRIDEVTAAFRGLRGRAATP